MKKSLKKLRKQCKILAYQVDALELTLRIKELQGQTARAKPFGFCQGKAKENAE